MKQTNRLLLMFSGLVLAFAGMTGTAQASLLNEPAKTSPDEMPPSIGHLQEIEPDFDFEASKDSMPMDIRREALKEAALSFGARGGLAARTYEIRRQLETRSSYLDRVYNFRNLLIPAPSGLMIEPPVISESLDALLVEGDGQTAAVSDAIYNINRNARIVTAARNWRLYLEREWGSVQDPPDILRPRNHEERVLWRKLVEEGWAQGVTQANEIFEEDLNRLTADFNGMIRYRKLLTQGMVSAPYADETNRGITGGGEEMRVGDRAITITGKPQLLTGGSEWKPASR